METKKEEAIRKAYGDYWEQVKDKVDKYGRLTYKQCWDIWNGDDAESHFYKVILEDKTIELRNDYEGYYQPKSLQGIETNNGWVRIESEEDYPNPGQYWVIDDDGDMFITDMGFFEDMFDWCAIRYYQPIIKPKPIS